MEKLPFEIWWKIFDEVFEKNPMDLYRLRVVCNTWKSCIDQNLPLLYKKWHDACVRDIPEDSIINIVNARFPMVALPWQKLYWKTTQLPHIPRGIHQAWTSMSQFEGGKYEVTKIPSILISPQYEREFGAEYLNHFAAVAYTINDKYMALSHLLPEEVTEDTSSLNTYIYKLTDLTRPIRKYSFDCYQIDFYSVGDREFIIFNAILDKDNEYGVKSSGDGELDDVYILEFLKNDQLQHTKLRHQQYEVIGNECFSYSALHFGHHTLSSDGKLKRNKPEMFLPKRHPTFRNLNPKIIALFTEGMHELLVMVRSEDCNWVWFFKYNISRDSNDKLIFSRDATNFLLLQMCQTFPVTLKRIMSSPLPKHLWLGLQHYESRAWLSRTFRNNPVNDSMIILLGNHLIAGTKNGKIFILHQENDETVKDFVRNKYTDKFTEINLKKLGIRKLVVPIGIVYVNSKLRIIALDQQNILFIDYPLIDKYVAITHLKPEESAEDTLYTYIYKLTDLTLPIRKYTFECSQIDFYTVNDREFIILNAMFDVDNEYGVKSSGVDDVYMSEFLKNDKLVHTKLRHGRYAIIRNECFSYSGLHFEHRILSSNDKLKKNKKVFVPEQPSFNRELPINRSIKISSLFIKGLELYVLVPHRFHVRIWFFKYNISRDSNGNLDFTPDETNFVQLEECGIDVSLEKVLTSSLPKYMWLNLDSSWFITWLCFIFNNDGVHSAIFRGNYLIAATENGQIFILHQTVDEIVKDFVESKYTGKHINIDLNEVGIPNHVFPIGVKYTDCNLRIIALDPQNIICIDYPLNTL